jgi:hypothetical protein
MDAAPDAMLNAPSEASETDPPAASRAVTRMRPFDVAGPGAPHVQLRIVPASAEQPVTGTYVAPPSLELSTSKRLTEPVAVQPIRYDEAVKSFSPPFGAVRVTAMVGALPAS